MSRNKGDNVTTAAGTAFDGPFDPNAFYYYKEIAAIIGVSDEQCRRWLYKDREWPYLQLKRGRRVRGAVLNRWVREHYVEPEAE